MIADTEEMRRLRWRCRRGLLELDILFQKFLDCEYPYLNEDMQQAFHDLLELPDNTLLAYLNQQEVPEDDRLLSVIKVL